MRKRKKKSTETKNLQAFAGFVVASVLAELDIEAVGFSVECGEANLRSPLVFGKGIAGKFSDLVVVAGLGVAGAAMLGFGATCVSQVGVAMDGIALCGTRGVIAGKGV